MANILIPGILNEHSIAWKWGRSIKTLPTEEKAELVIALMDSIINGVYCGAHRKFSEFVLNCSHPDALEKALSPRKELEGLDVTRRNRSVIVSLPRSTVSIAPTTTTGISIGKVIIEPPETCEINI